MEAVNEVESKKEAEISGQEEILKRMIKEIFTSEVSEFITIKIEKMLSEVILPEEGMEIKNKLPSIEPEKPNQADSELRNRLDALEGEIVTLRSLWVIAERDNPSERMDMMYKRLGGVHAILSAWIYLYSSSLQLKIANMALNIDHRFDSLEGNIDHRFDPLEGNIDHRFDSLEGKIDRLLG